MSTLLERISQSHDRPSDDGYQERVLRDVFAYLCSLGESEHLFCDSKNYPIAIHALILFSFMDSEALEWYKPRISKCLTTCYHCLVKFQCGRCDLKQSFLINRKIKYNSVKEFNDIILSWESARIIKSLENLYAHLQSPHTVLTSDIRLTLTECLLGPGMFRVNPMVKTLFSHCFILSLSKGIFTQPLKLFPASLYLLFEGTADEKIWCVEFLKTIKSIDLEDWDSLMMEETFYHQINIQNPQFYSDDNCITFWSVFKPFILLMTPQVIETKLFNVPGLSFIGKTFPFQVVQLNTVLTNQLFAFLDLPLPVLLSILNLLLVKLGSTFWKIVKPFTFINFLTPIFGSPHYVKYMKQSQLPQNSFYIIEDLFSWLPSLYDSLPSTSPQKQQAGLRISLFLFSQFREALNKGFLLSSAFKILVQCCKMESSLHDASLPLELLSKVDTRNFLNINSEIFTYTVRGGKNFKPDLNVSSLDQVSNPIRSDAIKILSYAILYDIYCFAERGHNLKENKNINLGNITFNSKFWDDLVDRIVINDIPFVVEILSVLSKMCCINPINIKLFNLQHKLTEEGKNSNILNQIHSFNLEVIILFSKVTKLLEKINSFDELLLRAILSIPSSANGFWSCMLSSDKTTSQSATNLLYEAYEVQGRLEGVKDAMGANTHAVLSSLLTCLKSLTFIDFYDPCPSAVRLMMDVVSSLSDPVDGAFIDMTKSTTPLTVVDDLKQFWIECWHFLDFIYRRTLNWAQVFPLSLLTDFTRDTLDLSHMLLDCYKTVESITGAQSLFMDILNTFENMLVWLRLGDMSLLASCVALVFKTLDLSDEKNLPIDSKIILLLAQYGARAKRFNNRLTEKQRIDILDRARAFDDELVDKIVESANAYREGPVSEKRAIPTVQPEIVEINDDDDDDDINDTNVKTSTATNLKSVRQSELSKFLSSTNAAPVAPAPKQPPQKTSLLLAAKQSLANKRTSTAKLAAAPAPARSAGFNRKKTQKSDSDSSDSDSDDGVDSLFRPTTEKTKTLSHKLKNTPMSLPHRSLTVNRIQKKKAVDQKEIDAYNMRMRLNVDLSPLYKTVLSWNYARVDEFPDDLKDKLDAYKKIKDSFSSTLEYIETFEPLLLLECWQSIQQSKQIGQEVPFPLVIGSRTTTNAFFEVYASLKRDIIQDRKIGDSDMIVLSINADNSYQFRPDGAPTSDSIKNSHFTCFAKIKEMKAVNSEFCDITLRISNTNNSFASFLTPRSEIYGMKVMQMITIEREYSSLKGLAYYNLSKQITQGIPNIPEKLDSAEKEKMRKLYDVNPSQAQAIAGSVHANGFSLIQGPPGTGKTKTILGIVGYLLTSSKSMPAQPINIPGGPKSDNSQAKQNRNIFICAPSNAAVDELVLRLRSGIKNSSGEIFNPRVIRLGRSDAINPAVRDLTLEELVDKELNAKEGAEATAADPKIREEHNRCLLERNKIKSDLQKPDLTPEEMDSLNLKLRKCIQRKNELGKQLDEQRERISKSNRSREIERRAIQAKLLTQAQVICSTLSGSAHDVIASLSLTFETVVVDEAAQCIELSAIIPLRYGCKKCIMVGDPNQLPPTVLSQAAASYSYEQSLFVRMQTQHPDSVYLLNVQYRMHPEISRFPSAQFYKSKLIDGPNMKEINTRAWHKDLVFKPYLFYDIIGGQQSQNQRTKSFFNLSESKVALELVEKLYRDYNEENWTGRIGVISPYKEQIGVLRESFIRKFGRNILREIDFNTVDGFQGQEKEIIIMSCVRAGDSSGVGFLSDVRRMNVALTRSKTSLWILGSKPSLIKNKVWLNLINDAEKRKVYIKLEPGLLKNGNLLKTLNNKVKSPITEPASIELKPALEPVVELSSSGDLKPIQPNVSKSIPDKINKPKPKNRTVIPFAKQRNVISATSLKNSTKPNLSGNLPKVNDVAPTESKKPSTSVINPPEPLKSQVEKKRSLDKDGENNVPLKLFKSGNLPTQTPTALPPIAAATIAIPQVNNLQQVHAPTSIRPPDKVNSIPNLQLIPSDPRLRDALGGLKSRKTGIINPEKKSMLVTPVSSSGVLPTNATLDINKGTDHPAPAPQKKTGIIADRSITQERPTSNLNLKTGYLLPSRPSSLQNGMNVHFNNSLPLPPPQPVQVPLPPPQPAHLPQSFPLPLPPPQNLPPMQTGYPQQGPQQEYTQYKPPSREYKPSSSEYKPRSREYKPSSRERRPLSREHKKGKYDKYSYKSRFDNSNSNYRGQLSNYNSNDYQNNDSNYERGYSSGGKHGKKHKKDFNDGYNNNNSNNNNGYNNNGYNSNRFNNNNN